MNSYHYDIKHPFVYDKAKYHYDADDFPSEFPVTQAYVHTGLFVGWLAEKGFLDDSDPSISQFIEQFKKRQITGPQLYGKLGECLIDYMVTETGNLFAQAYFDFSKGMFIPDYRELLVRDLGSDYAVADTWQNYEIIKQRFDERFKSWAQTHGIKYA